MIIKPKKFHFLKDRGFFWSCLLERELWVCGMVLGASRASWEVSIALSTRLKTRQFQRLHALIVRVGWTPCLQVLKRGLSRPRITQIMKGDIVAVAQFCWTTHVISFLYRCHYRESRHSHHSHHSCFILWKLELDSVGTLTEILPCYETSWVKGVCLLQLSSV